MGNIQIFHSVNLLLLLGIVKKRWDIPVYYMQGRYIPFHFHNSPVVQVELSHLKVEENEPRYSDSTASSIRNTTSHLLFL